MRDNLLTCGLCGFFILASAVIQMNVYLDGDSAWLVDSASKLLAGKNLYTDYIETNPPFIVYFSSLFIWLGSFAGMDAVTAFRFVAFMLVLLSLLRGFKYVNSDFVKVILTFGLFSLPVQSFGQREHMFLALLMPYFLSILYDKRPGKVDVLLVTLGFLLKPYFVVYFIGIALWQAVVMKRSLFLKENFFIGFTLVAYVGAIYMFEHDYLTNVIPLLLKYYDEFYFMHVPYLVQVVIYMLLVFSIRVMSPFVKEKEKLLVDNKISFVMFAAFLGGLTLILQDKGWTNHFLPLYFFLMLSTGMLVERSDKYIRLMMFALLLVIFSMVVWISAVVVHGDNADTERNEMIALHNEYAAGGEILSFSMALGSLYPEVIYSKAEFNWMYPVFWMIIGMYDKSDIKDEKLTFHKTDQRSEDEKKLLRQVADYVVHEKPKMIVVTNLKIDKEMGVFFFNFIDYFSQEKDFAEQFKKYKFIKRIGPRRIYVLDQQKATANIPAKR